MKNEGNIDEDVLHNIEINCDYHTSVHNIGGNFNVIHFNVRSLKNKLDDLHNFLLKTGVTWDVICISETWLQDLITKYYDLDNYSLVTTCRKVGEGGGVAIYVHEKYNMSERKDLNVDGEACFVEITLPTNSGSGIQNIIVGEIYRPPNYPSKMFFSYLESILDKVINERKVVILAGDFNYNLLENNKNDSIFFKNMLGSYGFYQAIWKATRIQGQCESLLDNIFINDLSVIKSSGIIIDDLSDHLPIFASMDIVSDMQQKRKQITVFDRQRIPELIDFLSERLQNFQNNIDPNIACNQLIQAYEDGIEKYSKTYKPCRRKTPIKPWITPGLLCSINMKNKLYKKALRNKNIANENKYKQYRNMLINIIRDAKKQYISNALEENKNDGKQTWRVLNKLINKRKKSQTKYPNIFYDENEQCFRDDEVVQGFNTFFSSIGVQLENKIPVGNKCPLEFIEEPAYECLDNLPRVTPEHIRKIIKSLNPVGGGIDRISGFILQGTYEPLISHITFFFNLCLNCAVFPERLKIAVIVPIYKAGQKNRFNNYRPISLLPMFSKILEKIVHTALVSFLNDNNVLNPLQFGFRKLHSTYMPIVHMYDKVTEYLQNNEMTCAIYLDLKKAFDTVSFEILCKKIKKIGIRGAFSKMLESYLSDRHQVLKIEDVVSQKQMIKMGVPQGSILGPLLFIIYINDICNVTDIGTFYLFADDTAICIHGRSCDELQSKINNLVPKIEEWFYANRLSLNAAKTNYQIYSKANTINLNIVFNGMQIERKQCIKYLGILVDENLKWSSHLNSVTSVVSRNLGVMGRAKHCLSPKQMILLYNALVLPHLNYCSIIWGMNYETALGRIVVLQKRAVRMIDKKPFLHPSTPLFIKHNILRFPEMVKEQCIMILLAYINAKLPYPIERMFQYSVPSNRRTIQHFRIPYAATNYRLFALSCSAPKIWNTVVGSMYRNLEDVPRNKQTLKKSVRAYFINRYT